MTAPTDELLTRIYDLEEQILEKDRQLQAAIDEHRHHPEDEGCVRCLNFRAAIERSDSLARERNATKNRMIKELKQEIAKLRGGHR